MIEYHWFPPCFGITEDGEIVAIVVRREYKNARHLTGSGRAYGRWIVNVGGSDINLNHDLSDDGFWMTPVNGSFAGRRIRFGRPGSVAEYLKSIDCPDDCGARIS